MLLLSPALVSGETQAGATGQTSFVFLSHQNAPVVATWVASAENSTGRFRLYRGQDASNPNLIAETGVRSGEQAYRFEDASVCRGSCYYQLRYSEPGRGEAILKTIFCRQATVDPEPVMLEGARHDSGVSDAMVDVDMSNPTAELDEADFLTGSSWRPPPQVPPPRIDGQARV